MQRWGIILLIAIFFVLGLVVQYSAHADDRKIKIKALMEAQGLTEMLTQRFESENQHAKKLGMDMIKKLEFPAECSDLYEGAYVVFVENIAKSRPSPKELVDVWYNHYGSKFTDEELDALLAYYTSELGQKDIQAAKEALGPLNEYIFSVVGPRQKAALSQLVEDYKLCAEECKRRKNPIVPQPDQKKAL